MLRSSAALPPYAVEVPVTGKLDASRIHSLEIDAACGPSKFDFIAATRVGCSLSSNVQNPVPLSAAQDDSKALIWELDAEKPCILSLRYFSLNGGNASEEDNAVHLSFPAAILPSISSCVTTEGVKIFCVTADGALHIISALKKNITDNANGSLAFSLASSSSTDATEAIQSLPFASTFDRIGAPTALVYFQEMIFVGTALGHIFCLPTDNPTTEASFELDPNAGLLNGLLSGFFNRGKPQHVEQLVELRFMDTSFLCSIHCGAILRLWDVTTRKMIHSCDLIPPEEAAAHKATLARAAVEPLDATCSILLIFFEPNDPSSTASGMLCTFELFLEDRGGSTKVLMEGGPRLAGGIFRLVDLAVQHMGVHSIGAWVLYDDEQGRRQMHCVPLAFTDGEVKTAVEVLSIEEQIKGVVPVEATEQHIELLSSLASTLEASMPTKNTTSTSTGTASELSSFNATDVFQDALFAPGHFCRLALQNAVETLQWSDFLSSEDILRLDIASLRSLFTDTVNTVATQQEKGPQENRLTVWIDVVKAYKSALRSSFAPRALVKLSVYRDEEQGLLVIRNGGSFSVVRGAKPQEIVAASAWPPIWDKMRSSDSLGVKSILQAAGVVVDACGGRVALMMIQGCLLHGADLRADILPAVLRWLLSSGRGGSSGGSFIISNLSEELVDFHSIPLILGTLCSAPTNGFASAVEAIVTLLANECVPPAGDVRSPLDTFSKPVISACIARGHQTAAAQCECLLRVALLAAYVTSQHSLGSWTVQEKDRQLILGAVSDKVDWMLNAAGVAYWSTAAPIAKIVEQRSSMVRVGVNPTASETANLVISLKIGDDDGGRAGGGNDAGTSNTARKRARLTPYTSSTTSSQDQYAYPAEHLLSTFQSHAHAVRDLPDLQAIAATFSSWLLCLPKVHDIDLRRTHTPTETVELERTVQLAPQLIRTHSAAALTELMIFIANPTIQSNDPRVIFYLASSKALTLASYMQNPNASKAAIRKLERDSVALFFRVAATFTHRSFFQEKLKGVKTGLEDLISSFSTSTSSRSTRIELPANATDAHIAAADELYYLESLMTIYEKLGCAHAASRFAMAAAQHVPDALPGEHMAEERVKRTGRLWSSVFAFCLQSNEYEQAYSALLGNELADIQIDCVHQLVNAMVESGEIAALCALPFAHTSLVVRNGQPAWVSLLDEAVSALKKKAIRMDVSSNPQPYHVLFDFHVARGNFQAAASAMVSYARRLTAEAPEDRNAVEEAQRALAAAVGALGLVDSERAWLEDPSGALKPISSSTIKKSGFINTNSTTTTAGTAVLQEGTGNQLENGDDDDDTTLWVPRILTMSDLKIEHAIAVAKSSVAAVLPGGDIGTKTANEVFHQLVALKLHKEAFALADAAFIGTKQQRMREKAMFSLAIHCAELQLQSASGGKNIGEASYYYNNNEGMLTDDAAMDDEIGGENGIEKQTPSSVGQHWKSSFLSTSAASASWKRLRTHLETYEKQGSYAGAMNLRVLAVDAVLGTHPALQPPPWLLAPFVPPPSEGPLSAKMPTADVAGLLRAYLKHGRIEEAASVAVKVLSRVADNVPSVALPRSAAVCLPHALLEELARRVSSSSSPVKNDLTEKLNKVQAAAARQTQVLENIYAA